MWSFVGDSVWRIFIMGGAPKELHGEPQCRCGAGGRDLLPSLALAGGMIKDKSSYLSRL